LGKPNDGRFKIRRRKGLAVLMQQPEVDNTKIAVLGHREGTVLAPRVAIDNPDKVNNIVLMGTLAQNVTDILQDAVFERLIGVNLSVILTLSLPNGTSLLHPEYNRNNDTLINLERELKPVLEQNAKLFFTSSKTGSAEGKCTNLEGRVAYEKSSLHMIQILELLAVPSHTGVLILNGENDTQTPVQQALLLQQRLTEVKHPDHTMVTYPNLGHEFHPSSQWFTENGPIPEYVLQDIFGWLSDPMRSRVTQ
jgi:uncharacterized protein